MDARPAQRYGAFGQALHWVTAVLVLVAFLYGLGGSETRVYAAGRDAQRSLHESLGLLVLALAVLRVGWRAAARTPQPAPVARWMGIAARAVQWGLYALLFAVPLTAMAGAWLEGHPLTLLGGLRIEPPLAGSHALGASIARIHTWLGDAILWLAGLHAVAALFHHVVLRDGVLAGMLPRWLVRPR